jgi:hypothetical protein
MQLDIGMKARREGSKKTRRSIREPLQKGQTLRNKTNFGKSPSTALAFPAMVTGSTRSSIGSYQLTVGRSVIGMCRRKVAVRRSGQD